jgi:GDP-D-mannose dehydratase
VARLLEEGVAVTALRRDTTPRSALVVEGLEERGNVVRADVTDGPLLDRAIGEYEIDTVFHLAAQTSVGTANRSALGTWKTTSAAPGPARGGPAPRGRAHGRRTVGWYRARPHTRGLT